MSQHVTELCTLLVNEVYGELSSRVFRTLMRHGRLPLPPLAHHSRLPVRQVKHGLAVLIQQHLARHYTSYEDNITYYEADWKVAYALLRSGKIIMMAEQRYGQAAGELVSNLLLQGHTTTKDLAKAYLAVSKTGRDETVGDEDSTLVKLDVTLRKLLDEGLVCRVKANEFRPSADNYNEAARELKRNGVTDGTKGTKKNITFQAEIRKTLRKWRDGHHDEQRGLKRRLDDSDGAPGAKRSKTNRYDGAATNGYVYASMNHETLPNLDEDLVIRVNFEKYSVLSRNQRLAELAEQKIGSVPSTVYAELLNKLSRKIPRCQDDLAEEEEIDEEEEEDLSDNPSITVLELFSLLAPDLDLASAIGKEPVPPLPNGNKKHGEDDLDERNGNIPEVIQDVEDGWWDKNYGEPDDESVPNTINGRIGQVKLHLKLLAQQPHEFVRLVKNEGQGSWTVNFRRLIQALKQAELEDIIKKRFGSIALRLVRVLSEKGKLDEKQISNIALVRQKDIRATLTLMHEAGYLELQEVPRDMQRQISRTMFLWFFDPDRCRQMVIEDMYKTMARLLQRAASERDEMRDLLSKAERTDVVGHEDEYLSREERKALQIWRDKEERLLGQVMRLDRQVELFRDF